MSDDAYSRAALEMLPGRPGYGFTCDENDLKTAMKWAADVRASAYERSGGDRRLEKELRSWADYFEQRAKEDHKKWLVDQEARQIVKAAEERMGETAAKSQKSIVADSRRWTGR